MWTRFYDVEGIATRCLEAGDQGAPPLLLLHGHDLIAEIWLANIDALGENFRVFAPDMLGNGFTGPVEFGDRPAVAVRLAHLVKLADRLGLDRFHVCGTSYGALVGTLLALELPDRVGRLVINGSASAFAPDEALVATLKRMHEYSREAIYGGPNLDFWRGRISHGAFDPATVPEGLLVMLMTVYAQPWIARAWEQSILSMMDLDASGPYRILDRLEDVVTETLVTWGREDRGAPVSSAESAVARMPNAELVVFEQCRHMMMFEHPELYNDTVSEFLCR